MTTRITVLGGSAVVTPQLAAALAEESMLAGESIELVLVGRSVSKLEHVVNAARRTSAAGACSIAVNGETDVAAGVANADFIVNQVRAGGLEGRAFDERFPQALDLPGEETMGPGGFANAWRTVPLVEQLFRACHKSAPEATLLNLTNPAGMVHQVAARAGLNVITFCDSPVTLAEGAASAAGVAARDAQPGYVGTNHGGWLTSLFVGYEDVLPRVIENGEDLARRLGFDGSLLRALGAIPNVYLRYLYYPERQLAAQREKSRVRAEELLDLEAAALATYEHGEDPSTVAGKRRAVWYTDCIAPAVGALVSGTPTRTIAGITNDSLVPWLPPETMLEVPVVIADGTVQPLGVDAIPPDSAALLHANAAYEALAVEALLRDDREGCVRALAANPLVPSLDVAARAVDMIESRFGPPTAS